MTAAASPTDAGTAAERVVDGRRKRGDASRRTILSRAVQFASIEGLDGLSIGRLASEVGASKSGVATLFGSKLDLQLATVEAARELYIDTVIRPALAVPHGLHRLAALCALWLDYSQNRVFAGGCFFRAVSSEADSKDGPVQERLVRIDEEWSIFVGRAIYESAEELEHLGDPELLTFELISIMEGANNASLLHRTNKPYGLARQSIRRRLAEAGGDPESLAPLAS